MKEQIYVLENQNSFELKDIFEYPEMLEMIRKKAFPVNLDLLDEEGYDYTGPEMYYDAVNMPSCGLLVRCLQEFEDPDKEKQYSDTVTQNGSIKTQVIRVYDTDDYLQIEVEPIGPTNDNPLQTVQAAISVPGQDDISLTYDEMCIRGGTGIYVLHVCDFNQGNINVGVAGIQ